MKSFLAEGATYVNCRWDAPDTMKDQQWASVDEELELGGDTGEKMGQGDPKTLMCHFKDFVFYFEKKWGVTGNFCKEEGCNWLVF